MFTLFFLALGGIALIAVILLACLGWLLSLGGPRE